jgi:hypothetical protein
MTPPGHNKGTELPTLRERLLRKHEVPARPTIAELEAILATPQEQSVTINPDGTVGTGLINPDGPEAAAMLQTATEALEDFADYAECQVAAFSSGRPYLDLTGLPHLIKNARATLERLKR